MWVWLREGGASGWTSLGFWVWVPSILKNEALRCVGMGRLHSQDGSGSFVKKPRPGKKVCPQV